MGLETHNPETRVSCFTNGSQPDAPGLHFRKNLRLQSPGAALQGSPPPQKDSEQPVSQNPAVPGKGVVFPTALKLSMLCKGEKHSMSGSTVIISRVLISVSIPASQEMALCTSWGTRTPFLPLAGGGRKVSIGHSTASWLLTV